MYRINPIELHSITAHISNYYNKIITEQENMTKQLDDTTIS